MNPLARALRREAQTRRIVDLATYIDLGKGGAKWKHGWIPMNAEAEAILAAKSEHGTTLSHETMHSMPLAQLKLHYSGTIKSHGFQHDYTKLVGKAVGSHPESLAKTAATKAASGGKAVAPVAEAVEEVKPPELDLPPWIDAVPKTTLEQLQSVYPNNTITSVLSKDNKHIGYLVADTNLMEGKKHSVYDLHGAGAGYVNSFSGAQYVLVGSVGKPKKPVKVEPDPEPPKHPDGMAPGWAVQGKEALDAAPAGTIVSASGSWVFTKKADGDWIRSYTGGTHQYTTTSQMVMNGHWGSVYWGSGPNKEAPAGYTGPKYGIVQLPTGQWGVVNHYNGGIEDKAKGKPNASKKANDLNASAGTLSAAQKKTLAKNDAAQAQMLAHLDHVVKPEELNHPNVPVGASMEEQLKHTFDSSKAGQLSTVGSDGPTTPNGSLFGEHSAQDAKRSVARDIGERMAKHYGFDDQAKLDQAWDAMVAAHMLSQPSDQVKAFDQHDSYFANPLNSDTHPSATIKRGTPDFNRVMREKMVATMVQLWAASSNDDHAIMLTLQDLAKEHFNIPDSAGWAKHSSSTVTQMNALKANPAFMGLATAFLQSQYDNAQARLRARGIKHLTLRRGMKSGITIGAGGTGMVKMRPMSSWTTNTGTTSTFGQMTLQVTVPIEKVIGFAGAGFGCSGEYEVVLIGGNTHARRVK